VTAKHFYEGCHGKCKIFVLHLSVITENHTKFQPSTFQCSAQGTFHTNMQSSHFYLLKPCANCFHTLIWKGGSNISFGLIKGKCIIFLLPIPSLSLFGQLSLVQFSWQALLSHRHKKHETHCCPTNMHSLQIIQLCSSSMVPGTDYSDIGFYSSYRLQYNWLPLTHSLWAYAV